MPLIKVEVRGLKEVIAKLGKFSTDLHETLKAAGQEAGEEVVQSEGVAIYPPETAANRPPAPYYVRGVGTFYGKKYNYSSERYGTKFEVKGEAAGRLRGSRTHITNSASYGKYVGGDYQPAHMAAKGWRKVFDVATEKIGRIKEIYEAWIDRLIAEVGLD